MEIVGFPQRGRQVQVPLRCVRLYLHTNRFPGDVHHFISYLESQYTIKLYDTVES